MHYGVMPGTGLFHGRIVKETIISTPTTAPPDSPQPLENKMPGDERPLFRDLLDRAIGQGLRSVKTECIAYERGQDRHAFFEAVVSMQMEDGKTEEFFGHGDSDDENTDPMIRPHYLRMAETRAIARALRWATNEGRTCVEELPTFEGHLPEIDFVNQKIRRNKARHNEVPTRQPFTSVDDVLHSISKGQSFISWHRADALRREILENPKTLSGNSLELLNAYCERLPVEYKNSGAE